MVWDVEPRRRYHHGDLRRALVHAAAELLREGGQDALTLRAVARRSGVSHSAPYRHFSDRAALVSAVAAHAFADLVACIHAAPPSPEAAATEIVRFALDAPERYRLMSDTLASGQSAVLGALERSAPDHAQAVWALAHGAALLGLAGAVSDPVRLAERGARALGDY